METHCKMFDILFYKTNVFFSRLCSYPSRDLPTQSQQWKFNNSVWDLFKVNNKDTRTRHWRRCRGFIVNFEQRFHLLFLCFHGWLEQRNIEWDISPDKSFFCIMLDWIKFTLHGMLSQLLLIDQYLQSTFCLRRHRDGATINLVCSLLSNIGLDRTKLFVSSTWISSLIWL